MVNNYFFTGEKRIGKTTIINLLCEKFNERIGGFRTVKNIDDNKKISFHFLNVNNNDTPNNNNLLFYRSKNEDENNIVDKFNKFSVVLNNFKNYNIIIMDEIGPHENKAEIFKEKIIKVLDSDILVIGVLQKADSDFINYIKNRDDTKVFIVTNENRDKIKQIITNKSRSIKEILNQIEMII